MHKAILLYNPASGRRRTLADVETALSVLRAGGVEAAAAKTRAAGDASEQVKEAIADGCDTVFACGGDGTINDVLQGLIGTDVALGIIPLGTANCVAHDIGLPLTPAAAAQAALTATPRRIAVGRIEYQGLDARPLSRHFIFIVGIGPDAHMFYKINVAVKRWFGMAAYCAKATRLWLMHKMVHFAVEFSQGSQTHRTEVTQLLAVRIQNLGGVLRELAPGASIERDDMRLVLFRTRSRAAYLGYITRGIVGTRWNVPGIDLVHSSSLRCNQLPSSNGTRILIEADGELLGTLPANISMVPKAVNLLFPTS